MLVQLIHSIDGSGSKSSFVVLKSTLWEELPAKQLPAYGDALSPLGGPVCTVVLGVTSRAQQSLTFQFFNFVKYHFPI